MSENHRWIGKALTDNKTGLQHYRVGKYRLICVTEDGIVLVLVVKSGKYETVYVPITD